MDGTENYAIPDEICKRVVFPGNAYNRCGRDHYYCIFGIPDYDLDKEYKSMDALKGSCSSECFHPSCSDLPDAHDFVACKECSNSFGNGCDRSFPTGVKKSFGKAGRETVYIVGCSI